MNARDQIDAIRSVRIAAHDLQNVCAAIVGGVEMAVSVPTVGELGRGTRGLAPEKLEQGRDRS